MATANGYLYVVGGSSGSDGTGTVRNAVYYASSSRLKVGGSLDLVGYGGENLNEGNSGGQLTAGNTGIVGSLSVQDSASFAKGVTIGGILHVNDGVRVDGNIDLSTASSTGGALTKGNVRWLHDGGSSSNFFGGLTSGNLTNTGTNDVGVGSLVLQGLTSGSSNAALGYQALNLNTTGSNNVAVGTGAGNTSNTSNANVSGSNNTFIGYNAGPNSTTQYSNASAIGTNAVVGQNDSLVLGCISGTNSCSTSTNVGIGIAAPDQALHIDRGAAKSHIHITNDATGHGTTDGYFLGLDSIGSGYVLNYMNMPMYIGVNGSPQITIRPTTGDVGISNSSAAYLLHVGSSSITSGTSVARFENAGGTCTVTPNTAGGITCTSDQRLKKNIEDYSGAIDIVKQIDVKQYNMLADSDAAQKQIGVIAQQLEHVVPSLVNTDKEGYKSVSYSGFTPILLQAIKEQQQEIDQLKKTGGTPVTVASASDKGIDTKELAIAAIAVVVVSVVLTRILPRRLIIRRRTRQARK